MKKSIKILIGSILIGISITSIYFAKPTKTKDIKQEYLKQIEINRERKFRDEIFGLKLESKTKRIAGNYNKDWGIHIDTKIKLKAYNDYTSILYHKNRKFKKFRSALNLKPKDFTDYEEVKRLFSDLLIWINGIRIDDKFMESFNETPVYLRPENFLKYWSSYKNKQKSLVEVTTIVHLKRPKFTKKKYIDDAVNQINSEIELISKDYLDQIFSLINDKKKMELILLREKLEEE